MSNHSENSLLNRCDIVCWLLAVCFGAFVAASLIKCANWYILLALIVAIIAGFIAAYVLKMIFCEGGSETLEADTGAVTPAAVAAPVVSEPVAAASTSAQTVAPTKKAPVKKVAAKAVAKKSTAAKAAAKPKTKAKTAPATPKLLKKAPAKGADDLKQIKGVGPGLETTLNDMGIYTFSQVAEWKKKDIDWVDERLKFKGRITRDGWVKQAKSLAKS